MNSAVSRLMAGLWLWIGRGSNQKDACLKENKLGFGSIFAPEDEPCLFMRLP